MSNDAIPSPSVRAAALCSCGHPATSHSQADGCIHCDCSRPRSLVWAESCARLELRLDAAEREREAMRAALESIRRNYDHEEQTHQHQPFKYGGDCRVCLAEEALRSLPASSPAGSGATLRSEIDPVYGHRRPPRAPETPTKDPSELPYDDQATPLG